MRLILALPLIGFAAASTVKGSVNRAGLTLARRQDTPVASIFPTLMEDLKALNTSITNYKGDTAPVLEALNRLNADTQNGASSIKNVTTLSPDSAAELAKLTTDYQINIQVVINMLIEFQSKFVAAGQNAQIQGVLLQFKSATQVLVAAVTSKAPQGSEQSFNQFSVNVTVTIDTAISVYEQNGSAPNGDPNSNATNTVPTSTGDPSNPVVNGPNSGANAEPPASPDNCGTPPTTPTTQTPSESSDTPPNPVTNTTTNSPPVPFTGAAYAAAPVMGFVMVAAGLVAVL